MSFRHCLPFWIDVIPLLISRVVGPEQSLVNFHFTAIQANDGTNSEPKVGACAKSILVKIPDPTMKGSAPQHGSYQIIPHSVSLFGYPAQWSVSLSKLWLRRKKSCARQTRAYCACANSSRQEPRGIEFTEPIFTLFF